MKRNLLPAMTMIELLIVVGIIVILSAATIPSYVGFADRRDFINKTDILLNEVRLVRNKALAGVTFEQDNANWGIRPDCTNLDVYYLGYDTGSGFIDYRTIAMPSNIRFADGAGPCDTILFERLTGLPILNPGESTQAIRVNHIQSGSAVGYVDVFVNAAGQIGLRDYEAVIDD